MATATAAHSIEDLPTAPAPKSFTVNFENATYKPNLGDKVLKMAAKSDAAAVTTVRVSDLANGKLRMAFMHPKFLWKYYEGKGKTILAQQFELVTFLAEWRNLRLIRKINPILAENEKILFRITERMLEMESLLPEILIKCEKLGVDPSRYMCEDADQDDVEQCTDGPNHEDKRTRDFNFAQLCIPFKASDILSIIKDKDGIDVIVVIKRQFGPGRGDFAYPGGGVELGETHSQAAAREGEEEVENNIKDLGFTITKKTLDVISSNFWDPRGRFAIGTENGADVFEINVL